MSYADPAKAPKGPEIPESTGPIAKDSLAADSIRSDGEFASNPNADILGVKGSQSTLANTDSSSADTLPPTTSRSAANEDTSFDPDPPVKLSTLKKPSFSGVTNQDGYVGGNPHHSSADDAPTYAADQRTEADLKPKGENLVEGKDIPPNRPTTVGNVDGGNKDPSRLAQQSMLKDSADFSGGMVRDTAEVGTGSGGVYDSLKSSEDA